MADEVTIKRGVRRIVLNVRKPLTVGGKPITTADQVNPAWRLGMPFPVGMDKTKINGLLVPRLDTYVKKLKPSKSFTPADIKANMTIGDLQDSVWGKVK